MTVTDYQIAAVAGLTRAAMGSTYAASLRTHDIRQSVGMAEFPALAVWPESEDFVPDGRYDSLLHTVSVRIDLYLGPIEEQNLDESFAKLRAAATLAARGLLSGTNAAWPAAGGTYPPGTSILSVGVGIEYVQLAKVRYGYFHPQPAGSGTSYVGFTATAEMRHRDTTEPADIATLTELVGTLVLPKVGTPARYMFVEFGPLPPAP